MGIFILTKKLDQNNTCLIINVNISAGLYCILEKKRNFAHSKLRRLTDLYNSNPLIALIK